MSDYQNTDFPQSQQPSSAYEFYSSGQPVNYAYDQSGAPAMMSTNQPVDYASQQPQGMAYSQQPSGYFPYHASNSGLQDAGSSQQQNYVNNAYTNVRPVTATAPIPIRNPNQRQQYGVSQNRAVFRRNAPDVQNTQSRPEVPQQQPQQQQQSVQTVPLQQNFPVKRAPQINISPIDRMPRTHADSEMPPFNAITVVPHDADFSSATTNAFTGIADEGMIINLRDRAIYDQRSYVRYPVVDFNTGILFAGAVDARIDAENILRQRPTRFKGRQQLGVGEDGEEFSNRQRHPGTWKNPSGTWKADKGRLFSGYQNPNLITLNTDAINTRNIGNLSNTQLFEAMQGNKDEDWGRNLSDLIKNNSKTSGLEVQRDVKTDFKVGQKLRNLDEEFEANHRIAQVLRVQMAENDPRFHDPSPSTAYMSEQQKFNEEKEDYFMTVGQKVGFPSVFKKY